MRNRMLKGRTLASIQFQTTSTLKSVCEPLARGIAFFFGAFSVLNILGGTVSDGFDANEWWISFSFLPQKLSSSALLIFGLISFGFGVAPRMRPWRRRLTIAAFLLVGIGAIKNGVDFYGLLARKRILSGFALPLSFIIAGLLLFAASAAVRSASSVPRLAPRFRVITIFGACLCCAVFFAFLQMLCYGKTDYRRRADAIVVFGARVYRDGRLSDALTERTRTACDLYQAGFAGKLIFSGGPGDGRISEPHAMKVYARTRGIPEQNIILDEAGLNTQATVRNTIELFRTHNFRRVLAVSHFYHLPRIKLTYQRAGWEVYTVPAESDYILAQLPLFMAREVAALGKYYFTPLFHRTEFASVSTK
jgi:uncharacterized SAM-binding protein YcdF (DUF218 family)